MDWFANKGQIIQICLQFIAQIKWAVMWGFMTTLLLSIWGFMTGASWPVIALVSTGVFGFSMLGLERFEA